MFVLLASIVLGDTLFVSPGDIKGEVSKYIYGANFPPPNVVSGSTDEFHQRRARCYDGLWDTLRNCPDTAEIKKLEKELGVKVCRIQLGWGGGDAKVFT